jgi:hypothetical protein
VASDPRVDPSRRAQAGARQRGRALVGRGGTTRHSARAATTIRRRSKK